MLSEKCERSYGRVNCRKEKIIRVRKVEEAYPAGLKQSSAKLLESHRVSINPVAIAKAVP